MKLLLVYPPTTFSKYSYRPNIYLPLGILYIAACIENQGGDSVQVYDTRLSARLSPEGNFLRFGDSWEEIQENITKAKPDLVGISNLSFAQMRNVNKIAEIVKRIEKNTMVVVGGQHPSSCPEDFLRDANIDAVIKGEGEEVFCKLLDNLKNKDRIEDIAGVITRSNINAGDGLLKQNYISQLDDLSFPAYRLYDMERFFYLQNKGFAARFSKHGKKPISMITSRGCPFNCVFCLGHGVMGRQWRSHTIGYVLRHINFLVKEFKIDSIHFEDDNINFSPERFEILIDGLKALSSQLSWDTPNGVRADKLNGSLLKKVKDSNCDYLIMGVESGVQPVLDKIIQKNLKLESVIETAKICRSLDLKLFSFFVIGFPGETKADMKNTIDFALSLLWRYNVIPTVFWASPYKGTRLYKICEESGYFTQQITSDSFIDDHQLKGNMLIKTGDFLTKDIKKLLVQFRNRVKWLLFIKMLCSPKRAVEYLGFFLRNKFLIKDYLKVKRYESAFN